MKGCVTTNHFSVNLADAKIYLDSLWNKHVDILAKPTLIIWRGPVYPLISHVSSI
jgi:hypothetical protein